MVRIGSVWDSTTNVLAGRAGLLLPIAAAAFFLPSVVQGAANAYGDTSAGMAGVGALVGIVALVATIWGQLATVAVASDPRTTRADAGAAATRRLPAGLLVTLVLVAAAILAALPIVAILAASGFDFQAAAGHAGSAAAPKLGAGAALFCFFYGLLLLAVGLWLAARLFLLNPVVLNERRGIGAIGRSMQLTRGLTWRLIGVLILFVIVVLVASWAAQAVVFLIVRLLLGPEHVATATFVGAVAAAAVSAAFSTVVPVFGARLYAAVTGGGEGGGTGPRPAE